MSPILPMVRPSPTQNPYPSTKHLPYSWVRPMCDLPLVGAGLPDGIHLEADLAQRLVVQQVAAVEDEGLFRGCVWVYMFG